jgi:CheY-like chemotaxis protein
MTVPGQVTLDVAGATKTVVVVDDTRPVVVLCVSVLREFGCRVKAASCGDAALDLLREAPADLLVADVKMPGMSGFELLEAARKFRPELRCIVVTGEGTTAVAREAQRLGVDGILLKPFTPSELRRAVESVLGR